MAGKELEIEQHLDTQRKRIVVRKIMWVVIAIILLAACAGWLGGRGLWVSADTTSDKGTFLVQYSKFDRMKAPTSIQITLSHVAASQTKIAISDQYLKALQLQQISPQPDSVTSAPHRTVYTFDTQPGSNLHLFFSFEFQNFGGLEGSMERLDTSDHIMIRQYVFP